MDITQQLLEDWLNAKAKLESAKEQEMQLRSAICEELLSDKPEGTHNFTLFDYKVKAVRKMNYSLRKDVVEAALTEEEMDCFKLTPELVLGKYKSTNETPNLDEYVTVKEGAPTLTIVGPEDD